MDAAALMFHARGYPGASVGDIAAAIGVHKSSVYHYVGRKEDLLEEIVGEVTATRRRILCEARRADEPAVRQLELCLRRLVRHSLQEPVKTSIAHLDGAWLSADRRREMAERRATSTLELGALVDDARSAGAHAEGRLDGWSVAAVLLSILDTLPAWSAGGDEVAEPLVDALMALALA